MTSERTAKAREDGPLTAAELAEWEMLATEAASGSWHEPGFLGALIDGDDGLLFGHEDVAFIAAVSPEVVLRLLHALSTSGSAEVTAAYEAVQEARQALAASPAPDPGAADWRHLLGWLDLPDGATLGEVEAAALGLGRHQGQAPCRDEEHVLRPWVKWCGDPAIHDPHDVAESRREDEYLPPSRCPGAASPAPDPGAGHPDAGNKDANHYDWFMPANPTAAVDEYLDDFEAKLTDSLTDPFVHDMAQSVLPLIAAYRSARAADWCPYCGQYGDLRLHPDHAHAPDPGAGLREAIGLIGELVRYLHPWTSIEQGGEVELQDRVKAFLHAALAPSAEPPETEP